MVETLLEIPFPGRTFAAASSLDGVGSRRLPSFVAGPENSLVASVFLGLSTRPASDPAVPLLPREKASGVVAVVGPSGVGKTHLLCGLVAEWQFAGGESAAEYFSADDFRRELVDAIKRDAVVEFRRRVRARQLLAIDGLDDLPNDAYLMQELRNTLDECAVTGAMVLVSASRAPTGLGNLSADVRSRLAGGLVVPLAAPGKIARRQLVRQAASALDGRISEEAIRRLADASPVTANLLFGALLELLAAADQSERIELPQVEQFLARRRSRQTSLRDIIAIVARYYSLPQKLLKSSSRRQAAVVARSTVVYLARVLAGASYEQIGKSLGGRDHSTIMHNFRVIDRDRRRDGRTQETLDELQRVILSC